jgi:hypothetical protein
MYWVFPFFFAAVIVGIPISFAHISYQRGINEGIKLCITKPDLCKFRYDKTRFEETGKLPNNND